MNAPRHPNIPLLELDLLRSLVAIAETGSFSGAAAEVLRTPSAISMQVKKVEDIVGRPVFLRDSRSVTPTPDGEFLIAHARRLLALNRETMAHFVSPDLRGLVRVGAPDDVAERFLPDMLRRFSDSHPAVTVDVVVTESREMGAMMAEKSLDIALINCGAVIDGMSGSEVVFAERLVWAMRTNGCAAERDPLPVSVWHEGCLWRLAATERLDATGRDWRVAFQSSHMSGQRAAMLADLAVAPIPASSVEGELSVVPARIGLPELPEYAIGLLVPEGSDGPITAFADHIRASFAQRSMGQASSSLMAASPSNSVSTIRAS